MSGTANERSRIGNRGVVVTLVEPDQGHIDPEERAIIRKRNIEVREHDLPEGVSTEGV